MTALQTTISPYDQRAVTTRNTLSSSDLDSVIKTAVAAQKKWATVSVSERCALVTKWMAEFERQKEAICKDLSAEMGRPLSQCGGEVNGMLQRARHLNKIAPECLKESPRTETETPNLRLSIRRIPVGVVALISPWNFPYLVTVNTLVAAVLGGNSVILKPSPQTPSAAEYFQKTFEAAGLPKGVIQTVHLDQQRVAELAADPRVGYLSFTGSVAGGKAVDQAAANAPVGFKAVGLELGGKDPAYVRADVDIEWAAEEIVDGAMFNAGQSCCSIERVYVHESIFDKFVEVFVKVASQYKLGDPSDSSSTLGPVISLASADRIRKQIDDAISKGAKSLINADQYPHAKKGTGLIPPTVLVNVNHTMDIMTEETFGPAIGIQAVSSDDEALELMNDSKYGLTASVWTDASKEESLAAFEVFAANVEAGTVFLNRADALDPALPWAGVKDSGRGISLSTYGTSSTFRERESKALIKSPFLQASTRLPGRDQFTSDCPRRESVQLHNQYEQQRFIVYPTSDYKRGIIERGALKDSIEKFTLRQWPCPL
jgi:acyl-CoA reductase-like NAD-dependent aldehyde dehydrogenase